MAEPSSTTTRSAAEARRHAAERALGEIPDTALALGRRLESELRFRARAEVLQALVAVGKIEDPKAVDLARSAFGFHVVAVETLRDVWGSPALADALPDGGPGAVRALLDERADLDARFAETAASAPPDDRPRLERARAALLPDGEPLRAAAVLTPHLEGALRDAGSAERTADWADLLRPEEYEIVRAAALPGLEPDERPARELVDAVVLHVAMRRRLDALRAAPGAAGESALGELADDKVAYRYVSGRLQERHAAYLDGERRASAEVAGRIRKGLFSTYLEATRALNGEAARAASPGSERVAPGETDGADLRRRIEEADRAAAGVRAENEANREVLERALERSREPDRAVAEPRSVRDLRAERRRRNVLLGIAGVLVVASAAVQVLLHDRAPGSPAAPFAPVAAALPSGEVFPVGDVLTVEISTWVWKDMTPAERREHVERASEAARRSGARAMHVVDERRAELARWTAERGVEIPAD